MRSETLTCLCDADDDDGDDDDQGHAKHGSKLRGQHRRVAAVAVPLR